MAIIGSNRDLWAAIYTNRGGTVPPGSTDWDVVWLVIDQTPNRGGQRNGMTYRDLIQLLVANTDTVYPSDNTNDLLRKYYARLAGIAGIIPAYAPPGSSDNDILRLIANTPIFSLDVPDPSVWDLTSDNPSEIDAIANSAPPAAVNFGMRWSIDGGATWNSPGDPYSPIGGELVGATAPTGSTGTAQIRWIDSVGVPLSDWSASKTVIVS